MSDSLPAAPGGEFILFQTEDGRTRLEVRFKNETVWLSLNQMAALFQRDKSVVSRHIKNIFDEGELTRSAVVAESATTAADGKTYQVEFYNLDVIISVGYRVKSHRGTQFRIWATQRLRFSGKQRIDLDHPAVLIGPNNCGKTSAIQAIALWSQAVKVWVSG